MPIFDAAIFDSAIFDTDDPAIITALLEENWGEGSIIPRRKAGIKLNQYKQFKYIDSSGNTYYRRPDVGY